MPVSEASNGSRPPEADLSRTYVLVLVTEVVVVLTLLWVSRHFS